MKLDITRPLLYKHKGKEYELMLSSSLIEDDTIIEGKYAPAHLEDVIFPVYFKKNGYEYTREWKKIDNGYESKYVRKSHSIVVRNKVEADDLQAKLDELKDLYDNSLRKLESAINDNYDLRKENHDLREENEGLKQMAEQCLDNISKLNTDNYHLRTERNGYYNGLSHSNTLNAELTETNAMLNEQTARLTEELNTSIEIRNNQEKRVKELIEDSNNLYNRIIEAKILYIKHPFKAAWKIINGNFEL